MSTLTTKMYTRKFQFVDGKTLIKPKEVKVVHKVNIKNKRNIQRKNNRENKRKTVIKGYI